MIIGRPGEGHYWQYMGEEEPHPTPESSHPLREVLAGAREVANAREVTRRLREMSEGIAEVINADEELVELRPGSRLLGGSQHS